MFALLLKRLMFYLGDKKEHLRSLWTLSLSLLIETEQILFFRSQVFIGKISLVFALDWDVLCILYRIVLLLVYDEWHCNTNDIVMPSPVLCNSIAHYYHRNLAMWWHFLWSRAIISWTLTILSVKRNWQ